MEGIQGSKEGTIKKE